MPGQILVATRQFSDYIPWPDITETALQDAIPTESYGNFGLAEDRQFDPVPDHQTFTALTCANVESRLLHLVAASDRCYPLLTLGRRTLSHAG
jgi:hypothetical protein